MFSYLFEISDFCSLEAKCSDICVPLLRDQYICDCAEGRLLNPDKTTCEDSKYSAYKGLTLLKTLVQTWC